MTLWLDTAQAEPASPAASSRGGSRGIHAFPEEESALILLNLCLLVGIMLVQAGFAALLGPPEGWVVSLFGARFAMQAAELLVIQGDGAGWGERRLRVYRHVSIALHLLFATVIALVSQRVDSHYSALMVLPIVAAAFRYPPAGAALVALFAAGVSILEVRLGGEAGAANEYFEALSTGLIYLLVAVVVATLARQLWREEDRRQGALEELALTRGRLAQEEKLGAVGRFASAVAHEIRNPIAMIASSLSAAIECDGDEPTRQEMYAIASAEAGRLERFTGDFLAYARPAPPERETVDAASALRYVAELAGAQAREHGVTVRVADGETAALWADPYQLEQALLNLVRNAVQASPAGGEVVLRCEASTGTCGLHVENEGTAIEPAKADRVFEPFFSGRPGGSGLGLGIVRNIAQAHGGCCALTKNGPEVIRFTLRLPLADGENG